MWFLGYLKLFLIVWPSFPVSGLLSEVKEKIILIANTRHTNIWCSISKKKMTKQWIGQSEIKSEIYMERVRRESFQVFNILGYFSHDPVVGNQASIKKAGHIGKQRHLSK